MTFPAFRPKLLAALEKHTPIAPKAPPAAAPAPQSAASQSAPPRMHHPHLANSAFPARVRLSSPHRSKAQYVAEWTGWARDGGEFDGNRAEAVRRMTQWLNRNQRNIPLDLSHLQLTSLPDNLPAKVEYLDISGNHIRRLPRHLPPMLKELDASYNQLGVLGPNLPPSLHTVNVAFNHLSVLPDNLGPGLTYLNASFNHLTRLPRQLPASLRSVDLFNNRLQDLPDQIAANLGPQCLIVLDNNPLSDQVRTALTAIAKTSAYSGPRFSFSAIA